jgi:hypothetical protein
MSPPLQLQLAVELTNIFSIGRFVDAAFSSVLNLARNLRKSGSDFLVEEELTDIFGRGRVNRQMQDQFRTAILKEGSTLGIQRTDGTVNGIVLDSQPGPTLQRALSEPTRVYLSTVIQISLLTWLHGRQSLATCISECMEARNRAGAPGASQGSGVEAIHSMLDACSSQSAAFSWSMYVRKIEERVAKSYPGFAHQQDFTTLTPKLLLACMDYLYIIQQLPEDRRLVIDNHMGFVTIVIWSHYCLDLEVVISGVPGGDIVFGDGSKEPEVIIKWAQHTCSPEICLFDSQMKLVLTPDEVGQQRIEACERLELEDFGTTLLWRWLNVNTTTAKNSTLYTESVQYVLGMALKVLPNLLRFSFPSETTSNVPMQIHQWQIYNVAKIMFKSANYNTAAIDAYVKRISGKDPLLAAEVPAIIQSHWDTASGTLGKVVPAQLNMLRLSMLIVALASVSQIDKCGKMPIVADISCLEVVGFVSKAMFREGPHLVQSTDLLYIVAQAMLGSLTTLLAEEKATENSNFMISEYGWTVFLSSVGCEDPIRAIPECLFILPGIPTKQSTQERRNRVRDAEGDGGGGMPCIKVLDRGSSFVPRCVEHTVKRVEYYGTTRSDFRLSIRHSVELRTSVDGALDSRYDLHRSYRAFHEGLWQSVVTPECFHEEQSSVHLPVGVAAGSAIGWDEDDDNGPEEIPERVCIALSKGDSSTRWLAVAMSERNMVIRSLSTCVTCAINHATSLPGKWLVII